MNGQLSGQPAVSWPVDGLVDRFVTDIPELFLRTGLAEPEANLFRTPVLRELFLNKITQFNLFPDQPSAFTLRFSRERTWGHSSRLIVDGERPSRLEISFIDKPSRRKTASRSRSSLDK